MNEVLRIELEAVLPEGAAVEFWLVEDRSWYN